MHSKTESTNKQSTGTAWTTPAQLREKAGRLWNQGAILASLATGEPAFPKRMPIRGPTSTELAERFDEVRKWASTLRAMPRVRIEERTVRHRLFGSNSLPSAAWLDRMGRCGRAARQGSEQARFERTLELTRQHQPILLEWVAKKPLMALKWAGDWDRLLAVVAWMKAHPRPGIYVRQMDIPGVHTKFIEKHRGLLCELLDCVLSEAAIEGHQTGVRPVRKQIRFQDEAGTHPLSHA